jgi:hypothetical protein
LIPRQDTRLLHSSVTRVPQLFMNRVLGQLSLNTKHMDTKHASSKRTTAQPSQQLKRGSTNSDAFST